MSARALATATECQSIDASQQRALAARADEQRPRNALESLAHRLNVSPSSLQNTLKNTAFKGCSDAEFIALVIISNAYELNPLLREIYAFPKKGGGIQAIVGYDGWIKIANTHPQFDGIEFVHIEDGNGNLKAIEGILFRKDRNHPTKKMVYLKEFKRNTDPWNNSPYHMLDVRCFCHTVRLGLGVSLGVEGDENLDVEGGTVAAQSVPSRQSLAQELNDEIPDFGKRAQAQHDPETGEVLKTDGRGMTEVDEETARQLDVGNDGTLSDENPTAAEGPADEQRGEEGAQRAHRGPQADFHGPDKPEHAEHGQTWHDGKKLRYAHITQHGLKWYFDQPPALPAGQTEQEQPQEPSAGIVEPAADDAPPYAAKVAELTAAIDGAANKTALKKAEDEYLKHCVGFPKEIGDQLDAKIMAKRRELAAQAEG